MAAATAAGAATATAVTSKVNATLPQWLLAPMAKDEGNFLMEKRRDKNECLMVAEEEV